MPNPKLLRFPAILTVFLLLQSCSIFRPSTSGSLALPQPRSGEENPLYLEVLPGSARVYRLRDSAGAEMYLTAIRSCAVTKERTSAAATTRQLIVGLENLRILNQQPVRIAQQEVLVSSLQASLEQTPLKIECYTLRRGKCTLDLAAWSMTDGPAAAIYPFFPSALAYLEQTLPGLTP